MPPAKSKNENAYEDRARLKKSLFTVPKMDCPSEEQMIRLALKKHKDLSLEFDLPKRPNPKMKMRMKIGRA